MTNQPTPPDAPDAALPAEVAQRLQARGIGARGEVELRLELERRVPTYTLVRLNPIAARRWKARYRIMLAARYLDCQSATEAYARALLAALDADEADEADSDARPEAPRSP